ncbi:MAG: hypothetical protein Q7R40_11060 [Phaeospirillum sp.]|nr:hypothetical protein [Phaeospirillum sp.]
MSPMSLYFSEGLSDSRRRRRIGDILVTVVCLIWLGISGWMFFGDMPEEIFDNHTSKAMQERMRACEGSFQKRYACKQQLLLSGERWGFAVALDRILLMCGPPITLWIVWSAMKRRER